MQDSIQKFRKNCIVLERLGILPEKLRSFNYRRVKYFFLNLCTRFPLTNVCKRVFGVFLFCLHLKLFAKNKKKNWVLQTPRIQVFYIFIHNSRCKWNKKKNHEQPDFFKYETCVKFQHKIYKLYGGWSSPKF